MQFKMTDEQEFRYRTKIDPDIAYEFAKHNCKKCFGRGLIRYEDINSLEPRYDYCQCVRNKMRRYRRL